MSTVSINPADIKIHFARLKSDAQIGGGAEGEGVTRIAFSDADMASRRWLTAQLDSAGIANRMDGAANSFRRRKLEVIHVRIQSLTANGRDRSGGHKMLDLHAAPGSREADFVEPVTVQGDKIIVNKTASGVFSSTNLDYRGYFVTLVEDACTTVTRELQEYTITVLKDRYARVMSSDQVIDTLREYVGPEPAQSA